MTEQVQPYRPLPPFVPAKVVATMRALFPRDGERDPDPLAAWSPEARQVLDATLSHARYRFAKGPDAQPGDRRMDVGRPDVFVASLTPRRGDRSPVNFNPANGELAPEFYEAPPDPRFRPHWLTLSPGCDWPDGGRSPVFPVEEALEVLALVRWAPRRPVVFATPNGPEPE